MEQPTNRDILDALVDFRDDVGARFEQIDTRFDRLERRVGKLEIGVDDGFNRLQADIARLKRRKR
jgi:hypothetical protein